VGAGFSHEARSKLGIILSAFRRFRLTRHDLIEAAPWFHLRGDAYN